MHSGAGRAEVAERTLGDVMGGQGKEGTGSVTPMQQHQHQQQGHGGMMQIDQAMIDDAVHALDGSMTEDIWKFPFG